MIKIASLKSGNTKYLSQLRGYSRGENKNEWNVNIEIFTLQSKTIHHFVEFVDQFMHSWINLPKTGKSLI